MALKTPINVAMAGLILASGFTALLPVQAEARGFFESLFGPSRYQQELRREEELRLRRERMPKVRISSPKKYTYRPDVQKNVSLAVLAKVPAAPVPAPVAPASADAPIMVGISSAQAAIAVPVPVPTPEEAAFNAARSHLKSTRIRMPKAVGKALIAHYSANPAFLWVSRGRVNVKARSAMAAFRRAASFGLVPEDYEVALPAPLVEPQIAAMGDATDTDDAGRPDPAMLIQQAMEARQKALVTFEMALSAKVLTYVLDATRGRIDPNRLSGYHDLPRKKVDLGAAMQKIAASKYIGNYLDALHPDNPPFRALRASLDQLLKADKVERIRIAPGTFLKPGKTSPELVNIVAGVRMHGSDALKEKHAATLAAYDNGELYTPELVKLIRDFQRENRLGADGIVGRRTIAALTAGDDTDSKIQKIRFAMERLRWLPREFGPRHVFINQPAFSASYFAPGSKPLSMRAIVGKKANQTNFFYDEIEMVVFNPYWGVPRSIIINEMLPKLVADPSYLDRTGYEVTTARGRRISSSAVNWYDVATKKIPINVRQRPGLKNALGQVKIMFPNKHHIYMHDTPGKNLFKRERRALSHGCVRLQNPRGMAAAVLGTTKDYISERINQGRNDKDYLKEKVPVYVSYFTAWPDPDGEVKFYNDVYDRDKHLARAMASTTKARKSKS